MPREFGVPPSGGLQRRRVKGGTPTSPVHPNLYRNTTPDTRAKYVSPLRDPRGPDTARRCSMANRSNIRRSRAARDYDGHNSTWPSNGDLNASRARRHGRKLFAACLLFAVPRMRSAAVQQTQIVQQEFYVRRFDQRVIMIGQNAPRKRSARVRREHSQQVAREIIHAFHTVADVIMVFKTRRRNEETQMSKVRPMRRRMPWITTLLAPSEQFFALFQIELTPEIARCGHWMKSNPRPRKRGTPNFAAVTILLFGFDSSNA